MSRSQAYSELKYLWTITKIVFLFKVIQPLAQQPILPAVKQSVKERLGPVPASNIEPAEAQGASTEAVQVNATQVIFLNFLSL